MSKVKAVGKLIKVEDMGSPRWFIHLINSEQILQDLVDKMVKSDTVKDIHLDIEFKSTYQEKTHSQLGYMHAAIWPQFYRYYEAQGIPAETPEQKERVRNDIKEALGFTMMFDSPIHGKTVQVRSFAGATKAETSEMIERLLVLAADFGILIEGPEEYKERLEINELI